MLRHYRWRKVWLLLLLFAREEFQLRLHGLRRQGSRTCSALTAASTLTSKDGGYPQTLFGVWSFHDIQELNEENETGSCGPGKRKITENSFVL